MPDEKVVLTGIVTNIFGVVSFTYTKGGQAIGETRLLIEDDGGRAALDNLRSLLKSGEAVSYNRLKSLMHVASRKQ